MAKGRAKSKGKEGAVASVSAGTIDTGAVATPRAATRFHHGLADSRAKRELVPKAGNLRLIRISAVPSPRASSMTLFRVLLKI